MYIPKHFKNDDKEEIKKFIQANSFGILVSQGTSRIAATHIPLHFGINEQGEEVLHGHISRGNEQWKNFKDNEEVLIIFNGPHSYISSSWYDHENVPTWNYIAVHVYGTIQIIEGEKLLGTLKKLVDHYEKKSTNPISVEKMSEKFLHNEIRGIVGFEILIKDIQAAYKLSQNRDEKNHTNIVNELQKKTNDKGAQEVAKEMLNQRKK